MSSVCVTMSGIALRGNRASHRAAALRREPTSTALAGILPPGRLESATVSSRPDRLTSRLGFPGRRVRGQRASRRSGWQGTSTSPGSTAVDNEEYGIAPLLLDRRHTAGQSGDGLGRGAGPDLCDSPNADATIVANTAWDNGLFGIFVRDSSHGSVVANTSTGNCVGVIVSRHTAQLEAGPSRATACVTTRRHAAAETRGCRPQGWASPWPGRAIRRSPATS